MLAGQFNNLEQGQPKKKGLALLGKVIIGFFRLLPTIFSVLGITLVIIAVTAAILLLPYFTTIKTIYLDTHAATENIKLAQNYLLNKEFEEAKPALAEAKRRFNKAQQELFPLKNSYFTKVEYLNQQFLGIDDLLEIGVQISDSLIEITDLGIKFMEILDNQDLSYQQISREQKHEILGTLYNAGPQLDKIQKNLTVAVNELKEFEDRPMFPMIESVASPISDNLPKYQPIFENIAVYGRLLPQLAGYNRQMNYLFLLENNDELRPAGGFIGTYGVIQMKDAEFIDFFTDNIYRLDWAVRDTLKIEPPDPIKEQLKQDYWFMRDANWWHDFPKSAQNVEWFYQQENGPIKQIDGVVAITQTFIESLLDATGPITVEGVTYTRENFTDTLQYEVEKRYELLGLEEIERKGIVEVIAQEIINRIMSLPLSEWPNLYDIVGRNIKEKHMLLYMKDQSLQSQISKIGWTGEVYMGNADYLAVVDANLAALKTDSVMIRDFEYEMEEKKDGLYVNLLMTYENLGIFTWKTTRYRTYNRVYAPKGSQLISYRVGNNLIMPNDMDIFEELGKQVFGYFFVIEPKRTLTVELKYKLPASVWQQLRTNNYTLVVQKQPGLDQAGLSVELNLLKPYKGHSENLEKRGQTLRFIGELREDMEFRVDF